MNPEYKYVWVVGFAPAVDSPAWAGGFNWFYDIKNAVQYLNNYHLGPRDAEWVEDYIYTLTRIRVLATLDSEQITEFIDHNMDMIEVCVQANLPSEDLTV